MVMLANQPPRLVCILCGRVAALGIAIFAPAFASDEKN